MPLNKETKPSIAFSALRQNPGIHLCLRHALLLLNYLQEQWSLRVGKFFPFYCLKLNRIFCPGLGWSISTSKSHRILWISLSRTNSNLCIYHFSQLPISHWITFPSLIWMLLYYFCANLFYSLLIWFIVLSLSLHVGLRECLLYSLTWCNG